MPDLEPYDLVKTSEQIEEGIHRGDAKDSLELLRWMRTFLPIRSIITALSVDSRNDEYLANLYEGGTEPIAYDADHATKIDIKIYNLNPNKSYAIGDKPTVLLMPNLTGIISPFASDVTLPVGQYQGQSYMMTTQNTSGWSYLFAHELK